MSNKPGSFDLKYWSLDVEHTDRRFLKFIEAMQKGRQVSFAGDIFYIMHIHMTPLNTRLVLTKAQLWLPTQKVQENDNSIQES